jgi:hypothetical protein
MRAEPALQTGIEDIDAVTPRLRPDEALTVARPKGLD